LKAIAETSYANLFNDDIRLGFHYPATLRLMGKRVPAYLFSHHYAHASYAYYESPYTDSAILSHDGGESTGYEAGFFAYGRGNKLYLYSPNYLSIGDIYTAAGCAVGFGVVEGPGKLMGLAAYGAPKFFSDEFVGNAYDIGKSSVNAWTDHCIKTAKEMGYDISFLGDVEKILEPINIDLAASTQKILEETMLKATYALRDSMKKSGIATRNLCLSGGVALNCPANTRIANEGVFDGLFVPPAVSDGGLSIGSALALYFNVMDHERNSCSAVAAPLKSYYGLNASSSDNMILQAFDKYKDRIVVRKCDDVAQEAAEYLQQNKIIGWFQGRSELGPRALGHRSLLANPVYAENWKIINDIKRREYWRPFASSVLESEADRFFTDSCLISRLARCLSRTMKLVDQLRPVVRAGTAAATRRISGRCGWSRWRVPGNARGRRR
jgi:carbamoyltransferase